jgi:hypothetical protein
MSVLFHHYKQLTACISEVERIEAKVNNSKKKEVPVFITGALSYVIPCSLVFVLLYLRLIGQSRLDVQHMMSGWCLLK